MSEFLVKELLAVIPQVGRLEWIGLRPRTHRCRSWRRCAPKPDRGDRRPLRQSQARNAR
jgi:hypothetical protein